MTWLTVAFCLLVSFTFSGIEAGLLSMNRVRLKHRVKLRDRAAIVLDRLLRNPERLLVTVLVVTNLMNIVAIALITQEMVHYLGIRGYLVAGALLLPVYLFGLELLPKSLFRRFPYRAVAAVTGPLKIADMLLTPMHFVGSGIQSRLQGPSSSEQRKLFVAREDFKYLTIESERVGTLSQAEREMIHNVVDFRAVLARDVMIPIEKAHVVEAGSSVDDLVARSRELQIDRWPVISPGGEIVGLVNIFDLALDPRRRTSVSEYQRHIVKVGPEAPAYSVLRKLRAGRVKLAAVADADGKPLGIVTWEELIKRIVTVAAAAPAEAS